MENKSFQYGGEEILRDEKSEASEFCVEELDMTEARKDDTPLKYCVVIDDAIVEAVCIANELLDSIVDTVLGKDVLDQVSVGSKRLSRTTDNDEREMKTKKNNESLVCNAIFRKGPTTPLAKRHRIYSQVKPEISNKTKEDEKPFNEVIRNVQSKFQDKFQEKIRKQENDLIQMERKLEDTNQLLRNKTEECEAHEREASSLKRNVQLLEVDFGKSYARMKMSSDNLAAMTEKAEESQRRCQLLESRLSNEENKVIDLESQLVAAKCSVEDTEGKLNEANRRLKMMEFEVDQLQAKAGDSINIVKSQEEEIKLLKEALKSAEVAGDRAETKVAELMNQAKIATEKNEVEQESLEQKERQIQMLTRELESAERRLEDKTTAFNNFQEELENQVRELVNF